MSRSWLSPTPANAHTSVQFRTACSSINTSALYIQPALPGLAFIPVQCGKAIRPIFHFISRCVGCHDGLWATKGDGGGFLWQSLPFSSLSLCRGVELLPEDTGEALRQWAERSQCRQRPHLRLRLWWPPRHVRETETVRRHWPNLLTRLKWRIFVHVIVSLKCSLKVSCPGHG